MRFQEEFEAETLSIPNDYKGHGTGTFAMAYARWMEEKLSKIEALLGQEVEQTLAAEIAGDAALEEISRVANEILNLRLTPSEVIENMTGFDRISYNLGVKDARHRATEMVLGLIYKAVTPIDSPAQHSGELDDGEVVTNDR